MGTKARLYNKSLAANSDSIFEMAALKITALKITSLLKRTLIGLIAFLAITAAGWYSMVWYQSRIVGERPVYLQLPAPNAMTLRWGTEQPAADTVFYGQATGKLDMQVSESQATVNHRVSLKGLEPNTRYYYRIKHQGQWRQAQAEWFVTSPQKTEPQKIDQETDQETGQAGTEYTARFWILGDPGKWIAKSQARDAGLAWLQENAEGRRAYADALLTTGDNAYASATNEEYLREFFLPYEKVLKNIPLWPVYGNHDARRWAFYKLFERPLHAESGGLASDSRQYFSFDYAQAHFIILDNHHYDLSPDTAMTDWLKQDIKQAKQKWVIVLFHHPPYTGGTYDSDNKKHSRGRMTRTRENLLPILENLGVDLVINGHSHVYERSHLLHCHYGLSDSFNQNMVLDAGVEKQDGRQYKKAGSFAAGITGTMYMVLGSSGEGNKRGIDHPALPFTSAKAGSIVLDINATTLTSRYITADQTVEDRFRIIKSATGKPVANCN